VLGHQLTVLRRQVPTTKAGARRPRLARCGQPDDAPIPLVLLPGQAGELAALASTHGRRCLDLPRRGYGRPPLDEDLRQLIVRLARENRRWGTSASKASCCGLACRSRPPPSAQHSAATGLAPPQGARPRPPDARSCVSRPLGSSRATCFTVDTVWLRRLCVLLVIELDTRRGRLAGVTANPNGRWVTQQARNLLLALEERGRRVRFLLRDRDAKFCRGFDEVFGSEGAEILLTSVQAPNANASAERWIRSVRAECLDWLLIVEPRHLEQVVRVYVRHYNQHRPHRALELGPPQSPSNRSNVIQHQRARVRRCDLLGGLPYQYGRAA
jgi:putative transposase